MLPRGADTNAQVSPIEQPSVELKGVAKAFGPIVALDEVTLCVPHGTLVAILGPSGSGKSTLLGIVAGYIAQDRGILRLFGEPIPPDLPAEQRGLGMVFQHPTLFPHYSVWDNVAFPLRARGVGSAMLRTQVASAVRMVGIEGMEDRLPHTLSGGQQQRVALARALVFGPRLVLLDEPLSALDRPTRELMQEQIRQLQRRTRATFVHVTHDRDEALAIADLIVVMRDGRIEQVGSPEELYWQPQSVFVAQFFGGCNVVRGAVRLVADRVETVADCGVVLSRAATSAEYVNGEAFVVLWPEMFYVAAADEVVPARSSVPARIIERCFLGHTNVLTLETPIGIMKARVSLARAGEAAYSEEAVKLSWNPEHAKALLTGSPQPVSSQSK